jgi:hypothetical protein
VRSAQNTVGLRGHSLPVATVRRIALAGLALATLAALVALLPRFRRPADPKGRAHGRDGHLIVPITGIAVKPAQSAVDVATMDALVALAERGERLILHQRSDEADTFLVDDGATAFPPPDPPRRCGPVASGPKWALSSRFCPTTARPTSSSASSTGSSRA